MLNPPVNGKIQGLFQSFLCFQVLFKENLYFKEFSSNPVYSSTFQACANPEELHHANSHSSKLPLIRGVHGFCGKVLVFCWFNALCPSQQLWSCQNGQFT